MPAQPQPAPASNRRTARNPYAEVLSPCLRDIVNAAVNQPPSEQVQLYAELQLSRLAAEQTVKNFAFVSGLPDNTEGKLSLVLQAGAMMSSAMASVANMAERVAKIEASSADKFSVTNLAGVVHQIALIAERVFSKLPNDLRAPLLQEFRDAMQTQVTLASIDAMNKGTHLTPDATALAMDSSIGQPPNVQGTP